MSTVGVTILKSSESAKFKDTIKMHSNAYYNGRVFVMAQRRKILKTFGIGKVLAGKVVLAWVLKDQSTFHGG